MIIYGILTVAILVSTQFIHNWADGLPWDIPSGYVGFGFPDNDIQIYNGSVKTWILVILAGSIEPIFPYLATAFVGAMLCLTLARPEPSKQLPRWGFIVSFGSTIIGVILILTTNLQFNFFFRPTIPIFLIQIGLQMFFLILFIRLVEYRGHGEKFANRFFVKTVRRWSMVALSMYALEIFDFIPEGFLTLTIGSWRGLNFFQPIFGQKAIGYAFLTGFFCLAWYEILIRLWSKINFIGSLEWMLIKLQRVITKQTTRRLDSDLILNKVHWIDYSSCFIKTKKQLEIT